MSAPAQRRRAEALLFTALVIGCGPATTGSADPSADLAALGEEIWSYSLDRDYSRQLREGRSVDRLPPIGFAAAQEAVEFQSSVLEQARTIDIEGLSHAEELTLRSLIWDAEMAIEGHRYFWLGSYLTPYSSPLPNLGRLFASLPVDSSSDSDRYLALLDDVPGWIGELEDLARGQMERGFVVSRENLPAVIGLIEAMRQPASRSPFTPTTDRLRGVDEGTSSRLLERAESIVEYEINPALDRLVAFLGGPYADQAPEGVGISQYPDGPEYYRYLTRLHSTMDVSPEEVQRVGYAMLEEFESRMAELRAEVGWDGTRDEFHRHLREDPRYFPENPEEVADRLQAAGDAMWAASDRFFAVRPEAPYGVRRLAPELEPGMTYGFYQVPTATDPMGYYQYNGSKLDERSRLPLIAIGLHELIPGHHFQITRQWENDALPRHRREIYYTAYSEGWGSYSSFLGIEADLFEDPLELYGLYILESFLATRLVVDPGMNYFGMTLEEARQFMRDNTLESEAQIMTESLRYSTDMPGQALGYQMGKWKWLELRSASSEALGDDFSIIDFHEAVLSYGSHPMTVIEEHVEWWIETR